jgi:cytochrome b561
MVGLPFRELLQKFLLYQLHKTVGLTVFMLACTQMVLHRRLGRPAWDADLPAWQRRAAAAAHVALFMLLIVTPILGYLTAATAPARVPTLFLGVIPIPHIVGTSRFWFAILSRVHLALAILLLVLACGHALVALNHHREGRRVLVRMWRG